MKMMIPAGIGIVFSIIAAMVNKDKKNVELWLMARRIDNKGTKKKLNTCGVCGKPMILKRKYTGERSGNYWVCSAWPECRKVEKIE